MKFSIGCYNIFRITMQLWQPSKWKNYDLEFVFPCNFQNKINFPALTDTMITQLNWKIISSVWIFPEHFITRTVIFLKNCSAKTLLPCAFASTIEIIATSIKAFSANCSEQFHSGELVLKMNLKDDGRSWLGFQVGYQPFSSSNFVSHGSSDNEKLVAPALPQSDFNSYASLLNA